MPYIVVSDWKYLFNKYKPTKSNEWSWNLLIVIVNEIIIKKLHSDTFEQPKRQRLFRDVNDVSNIFIRSDLCLNYMVTQLKNVNLVPLLSLLNWSKIFINIIGLSIFNLIEWFDKFEVFRQLKIFSVSCSKTSSSLTYDLSMKSLLRNSFALPSFGVLI